MSRVKPFLIVCFVLFLTVPLFAAKVIASPVLLHGETLPNLTIIGTVSDATSVPFELTLASRDSQGLATLTTALYSRSSPLYHHWLKTGEFAQRFGPTTQDIARVQQFLRSNELTFDSLGNSNTVVHAHGSIVALEHAFNVQMAMARLKGATFIANTTDPFVPATLSTLVTNVNLEQAPASLFVHSAGLHTVQKALNPPAGYGPNDIELAFDGDHGGTYLPNGTGQKIGVVVYGTYSTADITAYLRQYTSLCGTCNASVTTVTTGTAPTTDDGETALDIEQISGIATGATYYAYQESLSDATGFQDNIAKVASANVVNVASLSYGECEDAATSAQKTSIHTSLATMATQGQSFAVASGDTGANLTECTNNPDPFYPATEPNALSVGAVTVSAIGPLSQSSWYDNSVVGGFKCNFGNNDLCQTGGGVSRLFAAPSWQTGTGVTESGYSQTGTYCGQATGVKCREIPDVAGEGGSVTQVGDIAQYDTATLGGWGRTWGTSAAAPQWAAFLAGYNVAAGSAIGVPMATLYGYFNSTQSVGYTGAADVTSGSSNKYPVGTGYDMDTGLGSPNTEQLDWNAEGFNAFDQFDNRSGIATGWNGTANATDGQAWGADAVSNAAFSMPGGEGDITGPSSGNQTYNATLGVSQSGAEQVLLRMNIGTGWSTTSNIGAVLRWGDANNLYKGYVDGTNAIIQKRVSGTATTLSSVAFSITNAALTYLLKFKVSGSSLSLKVWAQGTTEPTSWTTTATDSSLTSGKEGIRSTVQHLSVVELYNFYAGNGTNDQT